LILTWLNDSSCLVKFESPELYRKAYNDLALSSKPVSEQLHIG